MGGRRFRRGVTLLEMLIVLAIVGVMSSVVWPAAAGALDSIRLRSSADSVASLLAKAAIQVERRQQPVEIVIDRDGGRFRALGADAADRSEFVLDDGVKIAGIEPRIGQDFEADEQQAERRFVLMPGAGWPALRIELESARRARRIVSLDPITGAPDVKAGEAGGRK